MKKEYEILTLDENGQVHTLLLESTIGPEGHSNTMIRKGEDTKLDFIVIDGSSDAILHLVQSAPEADLQCLTGQGTVTASNSLFLRAVTPRGEIPLGSLNTEYNPGVDSIIVHFEQLYIHGEGLMIYHGAVILGTITSVKLLKEENENA